MTTERFNCGESSGDAGIEKGNEKPRAIRRGRDKERGEEGMGGAAGGTEKTAYGDLMVQNFSVFIRDKMSGIRAVKGKLPGGGMAGRAGMCQRREMPEKSQIEGVFIKAFNFMKKSA